MEINPNNVYLGDAYDLIKKAPTGSVNLCYFDPPYSMSGGGQGGCFGTEHRDYHTQYKHLGMEEHKDPNIKLDSRSNSNCVCPGFDYSILDELERVMIKTNIYIWCSKDQISSLMSYYERKGYNVDLLVWNKCLGGTTKVLCKNKDGKIFKTNLKDLHKLNFSVSPVQIFNGQKWVDIYNVCETLHKEYYKIILKNGNEFYSTGEHKFVVNGQLREVSELKEGDVLESTRFIPENRENIFITKEAAWFIGYYIANGSHTEDSVQISTNQEKGFVKEKIDILCKQYGACYYVWDRPNSKARSIVVSSSIINGILDEYVSGKLAYGKHLNSKCWNMPEWFLKEILQGYLDGDGYKEKEGAYRIGFTRKNYDLQDDLMTLCNVLGYSIKMQKYLTDTNFSDSKYPCWVGRILFDNSKIKKDDHQIASIKKIKSRSLKKMYDIQLQTDDHLFSLSDGTITHNCNPIPTCNNKYLSDLEYCVFARAPGTPLYGSYATKSKVFTSATNKDDKDKYKHPTIKPLEMVKNHIINSSQPGDVVLDIFMGSGTTCVAAKQLDRKYIGFEIDEKWYNVAKDRLEGWDQNGQMDLLTYNI